jgi:hypothetical protein
MQACTMTLNTKTANTGLLKAQINTFITIAALFLSGTLHSQDSISYAFTYNYFQSNNIALNSLQPPSGYVVSYNCDSMLFVRGNFSDSIKIWTPGVEWVYTLHQFQEMKKDPRYGNSVLAKSILPDGRIYVATYMETIFIFRNDSLFEIEDTASWPAEYFEMMVDRTMGKVDDSTFKRKMDSIDLLYRDRHVYVSKLIFSKNMFLNGKKKVRLSRKVNYEQDEIELERQWIENNKKCYVVRINNKDGKEKTSYAYAINEDLKFIWWEGCGN